jgi:hypothetical protein
MAGANQSLPNWTVPLVDLPGGTVSQSWLGFFTYLSGSPGPIDPVKATGSPFSYIATGNGSLVVQGGSVSSITLSRARVSGVDLGVTSGLIPMAAGDLVTITYSSAPNLNFIPA